MVKYSTRALNTTFAALADPTRRAIVARLAQGEASVGALAAPHRMSLPAVSKHLRVLERAGLLARRKEGRVHVCRLVGDRMKTASEWLTQYRWFWERQFDALATYLTQSTGGGQQSWQPRSPDPTPSSRSRRPSRRRGTRSSVRGPNRRR